MKKTLLLICSLAIIIFIGFTILINNNEKAKAWYNYIFKVNHFTRGDKIFIKTSLKDTFAIVVPLWRPIRPITEQDIDSMNLSDEKKQEMKLKLNPLLEPYLIQTRDEIYTTYPDHFVGFFVSHNVMKLKLPRNVIGYDNVNIVYPNQKALKINEIDKIIPIVPDGYVWANNNYYLPAMGFSKK